VQVAERGADRRFRKMDQRGRGPDAVEDPAAEGERPHVSLHQSGAPTSPARVSQQRPGEITPHHPIALPPKRPDILARAAPQIQNGRIPSADPKRVPKQPGLAV